MSAPENIALWLSFSFMAISIANTQNFLFVLLKYWTLLILFSNKTIVTRAGINKNAC